ncbi:MAG: hypothetical protein E7584_01240, partial [Ruminococcaceae bacterium]|nr:hypothetical protein [Oscillospiraceae bacterium]
MKLFFYYAFCSVKNQLRKLFKTWVAVFFAVCLLFGVLIGLGAAALDELAEEEMPPEVEEEVLPDEEFSPDEEMTEEDVVEMMQIIELIAGGVILLVFVLNSLSADKNGCAVFLQADVNLLFASPMKPQSVLLFRLMTQIGTSLVLSIYLLFQVPNLVINLGVPLLGAIAVIFTWGLVLILSKLLQVLLYTVSSTYPHTKKYIRPVIFALVGIIGVAFLLYWKGSGTDPLTAAIQFFNASITRWIPVWGWLKGFCMFAIEGNILYLIISLLLSIATTVVLVWGIWTIRVDFYEDAMAKSEETAELQRAAESGNSVAIKRDKDRSEKLRRDGLCHGWGASVYFFKTMYNRFRFAPLGIFTKTTVTYLIAGIGTAFILRFFTEIQSFIPVALVLAGLAFFRSLGNPLSQDTGMDSFIMIPESPWAKMFYSLLGGSVSCALDLLPAMLISAILMQTNFLEMVAWILFIVTLDFYSTAVATFIDLSIPTSTAKQIRTVIQIMFIYFGLLPDVVILIVGGIFSA